jgi:hypothetical protein
MCIRDSYYLVTKKAPGGAFSVTVNVIMDERIESVCQQPMRWLL